MAEKEKSTRGNASQFFVAGELCRRGYSAVITLGNTPNTDILCSNIEGTHFVHIQVKTYIPGSRTCSVGAKAEKNFGENFFWVLGGIPKPGSEKEFEYYIIPSELMASKVKEEYQHWLNSPGKKGQEHKDTPVRAIHIPPYKSSYGSFDISAYRNK
jgi:hypothetical protein